MSAVMHTRINMQNTLSNMMSDDAITSETRNEELSHEELVTHNLLEILEERYFDIEKEERDGLIMLLIEQAIAFTN